MNWEEFAMKGQVKDFCITCRRETGYTLKMTTRKKVIRNKEYDFFIEEAICKECGEKINPNGLIDKNVKAIDEQYRKYENLVSVEDIKKCMRLYNLKKETLSKALGFGEITITRYLNGQVPSKEYSDRIRGVMHSCDLMEQYLEQNRDILTNTAYKKAVSQINLIKNEFSAITPKLLAVIYVLFKDLEEVTPLLLQKLLYYVQGIHLALYDEAVFPEECEAWIHGPAYHRIYTLFKDFRYNPIDDERFSLLAGCEESLTREEKLVIRLVTKTFGMYSGKVLEKITHMEKPWCDARGDLIEETTSDRIINKNEIKSYFKQVNKQYDISSESGINEYIRRMIV